MSLTSCTSLPLILTSGYLILTKAFAYNIHKKKKGKEIKENMNLVQIQIQK